MELSPIGRLSGVLVGDVWKYFATYGHKVWSKVHQEGLIGENNSDIDPDHPATSGPRCVGTMRGGLANAEPSKLVATVMLQGYYKRFLQSEEHEYLISFGTSNGQLGSIGIRNGNLISGP